MKSALFTFLIVFGIFGNKVMASTLAQQAQVSALSASAEKIINGLKEDQRDWAIRNLRLSIKSIRLKSTRAIERQTAGRGHPGRNPAICKTYDVVVDTGLGSPVEEITAKNQEFCVDTN